MAQRDETQVDATDVGETTESLTAERARSRMRPRDPWMVPPRTPTRRRRKKSLLSKAWKFTKRILGFLESEFRKAELESQARRAYAQTRMPQSPFVFIGAGGYCSHCRRYTYRVWNGRGWWCLGCGHA